MDVGFSRSATDLTMGLKNDVNGRVNAKSSIKDSESNVQKVCLSSAGKRLPVPAASQRPARTTAQTTQRR